MTRYSDRTDVKFGLTVGALMVAGVAFLALSQDIADQPDTTPCRTDVATVVQQDGPKAWPESCAGLSKDQLDRVSADVVADLLNG